MPLCRQRDRRSTGITFPVGRWTTHERYVVARDQLPHRMWKDTFARIYDLSNKLSVRNRFKDVLTQTQSADVFFIDSSTDWHALVDRINEEVHAYDFVSVAFAGPRGGSGRHPYVLVSTFVGTTVIFRVPAISRVRRGRQQVGPWRPNTLRYPVPWEVRQWLAHDSIVVAGTRIRKEVRRYLDIETTTMVDFGDVFDHFTRPSLTYNLDGPLIQLGNIGGRTSVAVQNLFAKGEETTCLPENLYILRHGPHGYPEWPWWRNQEMVHKRKWTAAGEMERELLWYLYHLSTAPQAMICKLILEQTIHDRWPYRSMPLSAVVKEFLEPWRGHLRDSTDDLSGPRPHDGGDEYGVALAACCYEPVSLPPPEVVRAPSPHPAPPQVDPQPGPSGMCRRTRTPPPSSRASSSASSAGDRDAPESVPSAQDGAQMRSDTPSFERVTLPPLTTPRASIAREPRPFFRPGCSCCGHVGHAFTTLIGSRTRVNCPIYALADGRELCTFKDCTDKRSHQVFCCSVMHNTCSHCYTRGHDEAAGCIRWSDATWEERRTNWEASADGGMYTHHRREDPAFGYFPPRPCTPWPLPFSTYDYLMSFPAADMRRVIDAYALRGEWPAMADIPRPDYGVVTLNGAQRTSPPRVSREESPPLAPARTGGSARSNRGSIGGNEHGGEKARADGVRNRPDPTMRVEQHAGRKGGQEESSAPSRPTSTPATGARCHQAGPLRRSLRKRPDSSEDAEIVDGEGRRATPRKRRDKRSPPSQEIKKRQVRKRPPSSNSSSED